MKIREIEFENFRNFKERGEIKCSTDGKITIIYGKNGDGKTTLHQLFRWIFYGQVQFNKTTTNRLYNLQYESEQPYGSTFNVMGRITFEHNGSRFLIKREQKYKKLLNDSEKIKEDFSLLKMDDDNNWKPIERPKEAIEKLLPVGLSEYFFFDGESMIADLRVKGKDSANKLRKALYSMFDLDIVESAISHIGKTDLKTTALGKLYLNKGTVSSDSEISAVKTNISHAQDRKENMFKKSEQLITEKRSKQDFIHSVSEQIGSTKSKRDYENQRRALKNQREQFLKNIENAQVNFGDDITEIFPRLLISKAVADAKANIKLKIAEHKFPSGISKELIAYLVQDSTKNCICGNPLCDESRAHIKAYLDMLPPNSFANLYNEFSIKAKNWGNGFDKEKIERHIRSVLDNNEQAQQCDNQIRELDELQQKSPDIEELVIARQKAENEIQELDDNISKLEIECKKLEIYLKQQNKIYDKLTEDTQHGKIVAKKINIMEQVSDYFKKKLDDESNRYSHKLEENIQTLINSMLTSKRTVSVSTEFAVKVTDNFNDESKSEGQFAVISFAYIGGILKMLQSEENLSAKEYPLVLDGPFSKLDSDQRQNVVNMLPEFAPQVIIFSKDDLNEVFSEEHVGRIWTIVSNDEKNVAKIEEGHLWK